jgi:hypothetical protein
MQTAPSRHRLATESILGAASGGALDWGREGIGCELEFDALTDLVAAGEYHVMAADCGGLFGAAW